MISKIKHKLKSKGIIGTFKNFNSCLKENGFVYTFFQIFKPLSVEISKGKNGNNLGNQYTIPENNNDNNLENKSDTIPENKNDTKFKNLKNISDNVLIFYSKDSNKIFLQRQHQIMRHFDKSFTKIFIANNVNYNYEEKYDLNIVPYHLKNLVFNLIKKHKNIYLYYSDNTLHSEINELKNILNIDKIIYDLIELPIEEYSVLQNNLSHAVNNADIVMYPHPNLLNFLFKINPEKEYHYVSNGCDYEHFSKAKKRIYPKPVDIPNIEKKILGYYGVFSEWLDYDLIKKIADEGEYHILMIGSIPENNNSNIRFEHLNITWLEHKPYEALPIYLSWFDVCFLPYKDFELIKYVNPCKLWEYMASGKIIFTSVNFNILYSYLSVDINNIRENNSLYISSNYNGETSKLFDYKLICQVFKNIIIDNRFTLKKIYYDTMNWYKFDFESYNPYNFITFLNKNKVKIIDIKYEPNENLNKIPITVIFMLYNETYEEINNLLTLDNIDIVDEILVYVCKNPNNDNTIEKFKLNNLKYYYFNDKRNYSDGRNLILKLAKNELILCLDVGNNYPKNYITSMYNTYLNNSNVDMVCSICDNSWIIDDYNKSFFYPSSKNILIKKNILDKINYYPNKISKFGEDTLFDLYYYQKSKKILFNKDIKVSWNIPSNTTVLNKNYSYGNMNIGLFFEKYQENFYYFQALYQKLLHYKHNNNNNNRIIIINSLVSLDDMGGGQRCTKLTKAFIENNFYVIYNNIFPSLNKSNERIYLELDPYLLSCFYLSKFNLNIIDLIINLDLQITVINEAPYPELIDFCKYIKQKQLSSEIIYDIIDNWNTELGWFWYNAETEKWFLENSDKITSSSNEFIKLYKDMEITYVSNGVDDKFFNSEFDYEKPNDLPDNNKKNILYYGSFTEEWYDFELTKKIAEIKNINLILIGSINEDIINKYLNHPNIYVLGKKENSELPAYLYYSYITIIPFKINEITKYTNPLKIYEYLAMKKPVILSYMVEVPDYNNSFKCNNHEEFINKIKDLLKTDYQFKEEPALSEVYYSNLIKKILE